MTRKLTAEDIAQVFPINTSLRLQRAAQTEITAVDRLARVKAVEDAIAYARRMHPHLFRREDPTPKATAG